MMPEHQHKRVIFHIDVNSAFLSWQAVYELQQGSQLDIRTLPSVIGGAASERRGIVLAKSTPAKAFGIVTGEPLWEAHRKCPNLLVRPPHYALYKKCSQALEELLSRRFPTIQRFSIDELFLDYTGMEADYGAPVALAHLIKEEIKQKLGFTVNIGIGENKLLAKMAGELEKPDRVHTLWPHEIPEKMWRLPVEELYMVGRRTAKKLRQLNIRTIGELAQTDPELLQTQLKSFGKTLWQYANGIEDSPLQAHDSQPKGISHSSTIRFDVTDAETAHKILLALTESTAMRLRAAKLYCQVISLSIRGSNFVSYSHQRKLATATNMTNEIYQVVKTLFTEGWKGEPVRLLGIRVSELTSEGPRQISLFEAGNQEKQQALDQTIDTLRKRFGKNVLMRGVFADGTIKPLIGGVGESPYPQMGNTL